MGESSPVSLVTKFTRKIDFAEECRTGPMKAVAVLLTENIYGPL